MSISRQGATPHRTDDVEWRAYCDVLKALAGLDAAAAASAGAGAELHSLAVRCAPWFDGRSTGPQNVFLNRKKARRVRTGARSPLQSTVFHLPANWKDSVRYNRRVVFRYEDSESELVEPRLGVARQWPSGDDVFLKKKRSKSQAGQASTNRRK